MPLNPTTEDFMAKAAKKQKRTQRSKPKPKRSVALLSTSAALRKKSNNVAPAIPAAAAKPFLDTNPAMATSRSINEAMSAFADLPARLMQCRTPFGVWREQALFAGRLFDLLERGFHQEPSRRQG